MRKIIVFNRVFFQLSETFIYRQIKGMPGKFSVSLLGFSFQNELVFSLDKVEKLKIPSIGLIDRIVTRLFRKISGRKSKFSFFNTLYINRILGGHHQCVIH